jgi:protein gp37
MGETTGIQWTDSTWNPVTGCTRVSPGCDHCYIERQPPFRMHGRQFSGAETGATTGVLLHPDRLEWPFRTGKRALGPRVFVCSLADLFHEDVPDAFIAQVFAVMAMTPDKTYQILTKRPARMGALLRSDSFALSVAATLDGRGADAYCTGPEPDEPLRNVWLGVSAENQKWYDIRAPHLTRTPAEVRFISYEPALGPIGIWQWAEQLDWVIVGGESGPGARPFDPYWARRVRAQCVASDTAFFMKQMGGVTDHHGRLEDFPPDLRVRDFPQGRSDVAAPATHR